MRKENHNFIMRCLRDFLCGILIGAGAILPGVSGGVLAMAFDLYRPFMELLTHPKKALPKYWRIIPALGLGGAVGFLSFARGILAALNVSASVTTWAFIGLIVGTVPSLYREAGKEGRSQASWVSLFLCAGAIFAGLFYASRVLSVHLEPNFWSFTLSGALFGLGIVVPGLATSSVLMALDLYEPIMQGLSGLKLSVLFSTFPGMVLTVLLLARLVNWVFQKHYSIAFHGILGVVIASTLVIVPTEYSGWEEVALSAVCAVAGFLVAFFISRLDRRTQGAGA
ncbi:hypothetical protein OBV_27900 [Oscillibacter valericigenes Sjm18-20]|nr:hypothetical protein OBV_27900 [Oscillibacter valericigenes Sjm18-20]